MKEAKRLHACLRALPEVADWVEPGTSDPITGVVAMGALRTVWRSWNECAPAGLVAVGDTFCHTDPSFALGLSVGLLHGFALADARGDPRRFFDAVTPELRERFEWARDVSAVRLARLRGTEPPPLEAAATFATLNAYARSDPDVFRVAFRRTGFLDRLGPIDAALRDRIASLPRPERPASPLSRSELLAAIRSV